MEDIILPSLAYLDDREVLEKIKKKFKDRRLKMLYMEVFKTKPLS